MDAILPVRFPVRGIDLSDGISGQPPLTTAVGTNVRAFDSIGLRGRGGSRPGILPIPPGQVPAGAHLIQHLNTVITTDANAVPDTTPDYPNPVFPNPSTPGSPEYWGYYPDGAPRDTRSPQDSFPPGGSGYTPNKNGKVTHHLTIYGPSAVKNYSDTQTWTPGTPFYTGFLQPGDTLSATYSSAGDPAMSAVGVYGVSVNYSLTNTTGDGYVVDAVIPGTLVVQPDPPPATKHCYCVKIFGTITKPAPDPLHWTGQPVSSIGVICASSEPGSGINGKIPFSSNGLPIGSSCYADIARFLLNHVGADAYATVTADTVGTPSVTACSADDGTCTIALTTDHNCSPGAVGSIIGAG